VNKGKKVKVSEQNYVYVNVVLFDSSIRKQVIKAAVHNAEGEIFRDGKDHIVLRFLDADPDILNTHVEMCMSGLRHLGVFDKYEILQNIPADATTKPTECQCGGKCKDCSCNAKPYDEWLVMRESALHEGQIVNVYQDPITEENYEGNAVLMQFVKFAGNYDGTRLETWLVQFQGAMDYVEDEVYRTLMVRYPLKPAVEKN
jgi:hypothetical protein